MKEYLCIDCEMTFTEETAHSCPFCSSQNIEEMPEDCYEHLADEDGFYEGDMRSK